MKDAAILVTKPGLGTTPAEESTFGIELMEKFLHTLEGLPDKPKAICFYTEGVKLTAQGSAVELGLKLLDSEGVRLVACQTCLDHYGVEDRIAAVEVVGMNDIVAILAEASKVITI